MLENIILIGVGMALIIFAINIIYKQREIKKSGISTDGIVFDLLNDPTSSFNSRYPVIRFLTTNQQWITESSNIGLFPGLLKKGQKVKVIYREENPKDFIVESKFSTLILASFFLIGFSLSVTGVWRLILIEF